MSEEIRSRAANERDTPGLLKPSVLACVLAATLAYGVSAARPSPQAIGGSVIRGYPYAARCPAAGYRDVVDRWRMDMCNCTSYVAWALQRNGQRTDWFIPGAMNAWNWPHVARLKHIPLGTRPRDGAVAVWPKLAQPFGHVAYVYGLEEDGGIDVAEYNLPRADGGRTYLFDVRRDVGSNGAIFIYPPARRLR